VSGVGVETQRRSSSDRTEKVRLRPEKELSKGPSKTQKNGARNTSGDRRKRAQVCGAPIKRMKTWRGNCKNRRKVQRGKKIGVVQVPRVCFQGKEWEKGGHRGRRGEKRRLVANQTNSLQKQAATQKSQQNPTSNGANLTSLGSPHPSKKENSRQTKVGREGKGEKWKQCSDKRRGTCKGAEGGTQTNAKTSQSNAENVRWKKKKHASQERGGEAVSQR